MKNVVVFTRFQLKALWGNRRTAIFLWLSPIFFLCLFLLIGTFVLKDDERLNSFQIAIVNEDPTLETKLVIQQLTENEDFNQLIKTKQVDEHEANSLLKKNEIAAIIYIPEGFSHDATRGINTPVQVIGNEQQPLQAQLIRYVMESAADYTSAAQSGINTVNDFMHELDLQEERLDTVNRAIISFSLHVLGRNKIFSETEQHQLFHQSLVLYYLMSFIVLLMMIWAYIGILLMTKQTKAAVSKRLMSIGVTHFQRTCSVFLSTFLLVVVSTALLIIPFLFISEPFIDLKKSSVAIAVCLLSLLFCAFFSLLQTIFSNERSFQFIGMLTILFGALIGGHFIPIIYFPEWLQQLSQFSINTWVLHYAFTIIEYETAASKWLYIVGFSVVTIASIIMTRIVISIRSIVKVGG